MDKKEVAEILEEIATLLELKGENPFRVRAYRNGARALLGIDENLKTLIQENRLTDFAGIGDHLAEKITELVRTGHLSYYEKLKKQFPPGLLDLLQVQGLGPKKVALLFQKLNIKSLEDLKKSAQKGKLAKLKGFGPKAEKKLLQALEYKSKRILWIDAYNQALPILEKMKKIKGVLQAEICGSIRRKLETVGDLDFVVAAKKPEPIIQWFESLGKNLLATGKTKCSIHLKNGVQADLRIVAPDEFVYAVNYFTGSKPHTIKLRTLALKKRKSLSEYGFEPNLPKIKDEKGIYKALGLSYIPPELREDTGEIEAAAKGPLPKLIEEKDIRGTLHNHTTASDGKSSLKEMVQAAQDLGWEYIGISDHSKSSFQANGLSEERLLQQIQTIEKLNKSKEFKTHVLAGTECDILPNGKLDFPDSILKKLKFVIVSIHSAFSQDEKTMTKRIIKALENPYTTLLAHPTGRLLLQREPYKVDLQKVIDAAIANQKAIEINGSPNRLDLDWRYWKKAADKGLLCCINCDAHDADHLSFVSLGVNIARKGWLTKEHVINTLSLETLLSKNILLQK